VFLQRRHRVRDGHLVKVNVVDMKSRPPHDHVDDLQRHQPDVIGVEQVLPCAVHVHLLDADYARVIVEVGIAHPVLDIFRARQALHMIRLGPAAVGVGQAHKLLLDEQVAAPLRKFWAMPSISEAEVRRDFSTSHPRASSTLFFQSENLV